MLQHCLSRCCDSAETVLDQGFDTCRSIPEEGRGSVSADLRGWGSFRGVDIPPLLSGASPWTSALEEGYMITLRCRGN